MKFHHFEFTAPRGLSVKEANAMFRKMRDHARVDNCWPFIWWKRRGEFNRSHIFEGLTEYSGNARAFCAYWQSVGGRYARFEVLEGANPKLKGF